MRSISIRRCFACLAITLVVTTRSGASEAPAGMTELDRIFADYALDAHVPGMVYGVVANGQLIHVRGLGVQDLEFKRPVTPETLFRIASMTKAFTALTILKLRDDRSCGDGSTPLATRLAFGFAIF
jgi:serine-type D-Ala-D-Ala carboxypeptidase/endopeptidase